MGYLADVPSGIIEHISRAYQPAEVLSVGNGSWSDQITFYIPWDQRWVFLDYVAGTSEEFVTSGGTVTRVVPLRHPERPEVLFAVGASCEGIGGYHERSALNGNPLLVDGMDQPILYSHARVTVDFSTLSFGFEGDQPFTELNLKHGAEYWTKPGTAWLFSNGSKSSQDVGVLVPTTTYQLTSYQNAALNATLLRQCQGKVNSTTLFLAGESLPAGTVRFDGAETSSSRSTLGAITHVKRMAFTWRAVNWNLQMREDGELDIPINVFSGLPPYETADLNLLLA